MQRRDLLTLAPVAVVSASISERVAALSPEHQMEFLVALDEAEQADMTPVQRAYNEWKRSLDAWEADMERDPSDENGDRWCTATFKLADDVVATPSTGPMDFAYKLMAYCFNGQHELGLDEGAEPIWAEARALVGA